MVKKNNIMLPELAALPESLVAVLALVGPLPGVDPTVHHQSSTHSEPGNHLMLIRMSHP